MKRTLCILSCALLTGCVSNSFRGILENKDVDLINPELTIQSPWGMQVLKASALRTRVTHGTNVFSEPLPTLTNAPLSAPQTSGGAFTIPIEVGITLRGK